jgi:hypothetical protein
MAASLYGEQQSSFIIANTSSIVSDRLQAVDNCVRSYGLTKTAEDLDYLAEGYKGLDSHITRLRNKLHEQKKNLPHYGIEIDSLEQMLIETRAKISQYYKSTDLMIRLIKEDSIELFKKILAEQRGMIPWKQWYALDNKTKRIQQKLSSNAQQRYESAVSTNSLIQFLLLLVSLPTLSWILRKLDQQDKKRNALLIELDLNNRKYLFDDGGSLEIIDAQTQLRAANENIQKAVVFINEIATGNYDVEWEGMTEENKVINKKTLAGELQNMRDEMSRLKVESDQRNWTNEGITILSEVIRKHQDIKQTTDSFLSSLVKYVRANQGAVFLLMENEREAFLELTSVFAYDKRKHLEQKIFPGDGLVGQVWLEKQSLFLTDIPKNYIKISSGMGEALPRTLLLVPIKTEDQVQGVLELASFEIFQDFEITFVEKIAEYLAGVVNSVKTNETTKRLLDQSQQQAEHLRMQEEEMRQSLEELEASQEEMARKEYQYIRKIEELSKNLTH